jgi:hypothetical protein
MMKFYASIEVCNTEDKQKGGIEWAAHREELTKFFGDEVNFKKLVAQTMEFYWGIQKDLAHLNKMADKALKEINVKVPHREVHKIRLMQDYYDGPICIWEA